MHVLVFVYYGVSFFFSISRSCLLSWFFVLPRAFQLEYSCLQVFRCFLAFGEAFHLGPFNLVIFVGTGRCEAFNRKAVTVLTFSAVVLSSLMSIYCSEIVSRYNVLSIWFHFSLWIFFFILIGIFFKHRDSNTGEHWDRYVRGNVRWNVFPDLTITLNILLVVSL